MKNTIITIDEIKITLRTLKKSLKKITDTMEAEGQDEFVKKDCLSKWIVLEEAIDFIEDELKIAKKNIKTN